MRAALRTFRALVWLTGFDPACWRWFRKLYGGRWERWWIGCGVNSLLWLDDCEGPRQPCGEERFAREDWPLPASMAAADAARRLGA